MDEAKKDLRTVFVRGISFDVDEKQLEDAFGDVGPVRSCFLVRQKGQQKHKGFGFVQYAIQEDAERAAQELNGKSVGGRKLQVTLRPPSIVVSCRNASRWQAPPNSAARCHPPYASNVTGLHNVLPIVLIYIYNLAAWCALVSVLCEAQRW